MADCFWKDKKVLITGCEGFLGSNLTKTLIAYGVCLIGVDKVENRPGSVLDGFRKDITFVKGNIQNLKFVKEIINKYEPQIIFHLAAEAIVCECNKNPVKTFKSNIEGTWNILEASRDNKFIEAIVAASSDKAYGNHEVLPYKEDASLKGTHVYDVSKSCADLICYTYWNMYKVPICVTRCGNIYGPGDMNFSRLIPGAIRCALKKKKFTIRSDGNFVRDYVYVEDIVKGYILLAEKMNEIGLYGEAFNLSNGEPLPVIDVVKKVYDMAGRRPDYEILNEAKYEIKNQYLDPGKAEKMLNWRAGHNMENNLKKTISWYMRFFKIM